MTENTINKEAFEEACRPLMQYLAENHHPHITVTVNSTRAELVEGLQGFTCFDYIEQDV